MAILGEQVAHLLDVHAVASLLDRPGLQSEARRDLLVAKLDGQRGNAASWSPMQVYDFLLANLADTGIEGSLKALVQEAHAAGGHPTPMVLLQDWLDGVTTYRAPSGPTTIEEPRRVPAAIDLARYKRTVPVAINLKYRATRRIEPVAINLVVP